MYSRSYYQDEEKLMPPENYNGTALLQKEETQSDAVETSLPLPDLSSILDEQKREDDDARVLAGLSNLPFLSGIFGKGGALRLPKIGTEEILILMAAGFLFFSKNGDKETAIILLILLLIN